MCKVTKIKNTNSTQRQKKTILANFSPIFTIYFPFFCPKWRFFKKNNEKIKYIRVLGFNIKGKKYLNKIKKECPVPIYTNFNKDLEYELKITSIYDESLIKEEIKNIIIYD